MGILLSTHRHNYVIYMGNYKGQPFVTSSESPNNRKTEIYDHASNKWIGSTDYAWGSLLSLYSTMSTIDSVYVFGGNNGGHNHRVARFFDHKWTEVGQLLNGRYGHGSLTIGFETLLITGHVSNNGFTEIWNV